MALLDAGVSMEVTNNQGQTAILAAIQSRKENAINVLGFLFVLALTRMLLFD
jgi:hypothetical protein